MKSRTIQYYFLILAIILGAFASMAQNDYGLKVMGLAALGFSFSFFAEAMNRFVQKKKRTIENWNFMELLSLSVLSFVFFLRAFFIRFNNIEWVFTVAGVTLVILYGYRTFQNLKNTWNDNKKLTVITTAYFLSIIFYTLSMVVIVLDPVLSEPAGGLGFGFLLLFFAGNFMYKELYFAGEKYSVFRFLKRFVNKSALVLVIYVLFTFYIGLAKFRLIPQLYSSELPQGYIQLVSNAESGEEGPQAGKYRHEKFKENMDRFLERNKKQK